MVVSHVYPCSYFDTDDLEDGAEITIEGPFAADIEPYDGSSSASWAGHST
jgi:hypothetical protein